MSSKCLLYGWEKIYHEQTGYDRDLAIYILLPLVESIVERVKK